MTPTMRLHPETLLARLRAHADATPDRLAFSLLDGPSWTWAEWWRQSLQVAAGLVQGGVEPGDRVAILAANTPLWPIADVGIQLAGATSVGLFPTAAPVQVAEVLADSGAVAAFAAGQDQLEKVLAVRAAHPRLRLVVTVDGEGAGVEAFGPWMARAARALEDPADRATVDGRASDVTPAGRAVIIYTSGSTGRAKGALLSHRTLMASASSVAETLGLGAEDRTLSFLPFSHAGERVFGHCTRMHTGMTAVLVPGISDVWRAAATSAPTLFGGMPRFFEKVAEALQAAARVAPASAREDWATAERLGRERSRLRQEGCAIPAGLAQAWGDAVRVAEPVLHAHFGPSLRVATSGGAALNAEAASLLDAFGVTVLGAYGQTEHLCGTMHRPHAYSFTGVGLPMPGTELRIASDGEILIRRSALTFDGYHGLPRETAEAFTEDGEWLRTGDLGERVAGGGLRVTGRRKELIALSTGKKVAPLPIESALESEPFIAQAVCVGEGRKFLAALLTLSASRADAWARESGAARSDAARSPEVLARIAEAVERVNAGLSRAEQVKRWRLLPREFSVETGELTATQKLRRSEIARLHETTINELYT